jgi:plasmid stabilization system protein ParE
MALEIVWTRRAIAGYDRIIDYMEKKWGEKKITDFIRQSHKFFNLLSVHPEILQKTENKKNVYRGPINKHTIVTYRINEGKKQIQLLNIRSSKQKPLK